MALLFEHESYDIRGAVFDVYREMGCGFLEAVYQECLARELRGRNIPFVAQPELILSYKGQPLAQTYKPDFICYGRVILEIKAVRVISPKHQAQTLNYLKATGMKLALLINFGGFPKAAIQRVVR